MTAERGSLREATYEAIRKRILGGRYLPAQHLVETALTEELETSKTPVREALARLEEEGLVESFPYRGYFVRIISPADLTEIYELRELYEGACARACAEADDGELIAARLRKENEAAATALARMRVDRVHDHFTRFDDIIFSRTRNKRLRENVERILGLIDLAGTMANRIPGRIELSLSQHNEIIAAIAAGDGDAAEAATRRHVRSLLEEHEASRPPRAKG